MAFRAIYHVVFQPGDHTWRVQRKGGIPPAAAHRTKEEAVQIAVAVARASIPSQLVVHGPDGSVEREQSFAVR